MEEDKKILSNVAKLVTILPQINLVFAVCKPVNFLLLLAKLDINEV